jgi:pimeloyl-ACP methyl ester carboxylesterase
MNLANPSTPPTFMIDVGNGPPLVMIPGLQGRWEWMRPAVEALATRFRVLTFSLAGDTGSGIAPDPLQGFDAYVQQVDGVLDNAGVQSATICGVSFGGLIAFRYAALRPARTRHLVLASPLPPDYALEGRFLAYSRAPRLLFPVFCIDSARRVAPELSAAFPRWGDRARMAVRQGWRVLRAPASPSRMRKRIESIPLFDFGSSAAIAAPALIMTGEEGLDRTVPPAISLRYLDLLPGAESRTLPRTGHLGCVTRPDAFAALIREFVDRADAGWRERGASRVAM